MSNVEDLNILKGALAALKAGYLETKSGKKLSLNSLASLTDANVSDLIKEYERDIRELEGETDYE